MPEISIYNQLNSCVDIPIEIFHDRQQYVTILIQPCVSDVFLYIFGARLLRKARSMWVKLPDSKLSGVFLTITGYPVAIDSKAVCPEVNGKESKKTFKTCAYSAVLTQLINRQRSKIPSFLDLDDISG